ncbi:MAG: type II toxin-antitoxin system VapC family toxin [Solirubrobacterales bacterium]|nr:type II toxin-antitoxin system VapC family toxin [Solirubrobacterales bacterium]
MIVVDSSALLAALVVDRGGSKLERRLSGVRELHAPELLDVEILHALRRLVATGALAEERAQHVREDVAALRIRRYPHHALVDRAWELRAALTPSDAIFVALAEVLEMPLVTCDPYLASTAEHGAEIELIA